MAGATGSEATPLSCGGAGVRLIIPRENRVVQEWLGMGRGGGGPEQHPRLASAPIPEWLGPAVGQPSRRRVIGSRRTKPWLSESRHGRTP